jgi:hypothetical protein
MSESVSQMGRRDLEFDTWNVAYFFESAPLVTYLNSLTKLVGQKINGVLTMGCLFGFDDFLAGGWQGLELDEPVVVIIGDTQFEVWFYTDSRVKIGLNTLTLKEESYQGCKWRNCSILFNDGIIGQRIKGFEVEKSQEGFYDSLGLGNRHDGRDYIESFKILLDGGKYLDFAGWIEYMLVGLSLCN